jgi:hypothetical protein
MMLIYWKKNINAIDKGTETLVDANKEIYPEVNAEKTKFIETHHQNAGQNHKNKSD